MFSIFKKDSELKKLQKKYQSLQEEAYRLSTSSRVESDRKLAEADEVLKRIEAIEQAE